MTLWSMIVWVVGISIIGGIIMQYLKNNDKSVDYDPDKLAEALGLKEGYMSRNKLKPYLDRIDQLEERVKVLERIATDKGRNLSHEIDSL